MYVGKHRFMSTIESSGILIAGTVGIKGNHKKDIGLSFNPFLASFDAMGVLYSCRIKIADPYEVIFAIRELILAGRLSFDQLSFDRLAD